MKKIEFLMPTLKNGFQILNLVIIERKPQYESGKDIYLSL